MRKLLFFFSIGVSLSVQAQIQQQYANYRAAENQNPTPQMIQTNVRWDSNDVNEENQFQPQNTNVNNAIESTYHTVSSNRISRGINMFSKKGIGSSEANGRNSSRLNRQRHHITKKIKRFERNFYGKLNGHKKSKHLVDVCFNWK
ncbi:MAG: hypothetical protein K0R26_1267 [Bacteroidota bacterium]|jgi:hypothetical protein|nr:hypothetical protein [Bacteroidota bacterium]